MNPRRFHCRNNRYAIPSLVKLGGGGAALVLQKTIRALEVTKIVLTVDEIGTN